MLRSFYILFLFFTSLSGSAQTVLYNEGLTPFSEIQHAKKQVGFKNKSNEIIIPARYDSVAEPFKMGQAIVIVNNLYGTIDHKGKFILAAAYKKILPKQFDLTPVQNTTGLWGFYSFDNKLAIPCLYDNFKFTNKGKQLFAQKNGKWGMVDLTNKTLVPFEYKQLESLSPKQVRGLRFNTWELVSISGQPKYSYEYDSVAFTATNLLIYNQNGWQGLLNQDGSIVLKNTFEQIGTSVTDFVSIKKDDHWGVKKINAEGWVIEPSYDIIRMDSLAIWAGITFGKSPLIHWKMYNYSGAPLNLTTFTDYHPYANGLIGVKSVANKWGFINEKGVEIIPFEYKSVGQFYYGLCQVEKNGKHIVINKSGDVVLDHQDFYLYSIGLLKLNALQKKTYLYNIDSTAEIIPINEQFVKIKKGNKYGLINTKGETLLPIIYSEIGVGSSSNTFSIVKDRQIKVLRIGGATYPVFDKKIISVDGYYNDYARMKYSNGKYGYIDNQGKIRIAPQYDQARPFENDVAVVQLNGKWAIINKYESFVAQPYYDSISAFKNNVAIVLEKGIYYLMNTSGKILTPEGYSSITPTAGGNYLLVKNNLKGIANANGQEIISHRYQAIKEFSPTLFKVTENNLMGVIDANRKILLHIKYNEIFYNSLTQDFLIAEDGIQNYITVK